MTSLPSGHPALRARLAEAIGALLLDHSAREVGRWIGRKGDTVTERADDVDAWPVSELLVLAQHAPAVADAVRAYVLGEQSERGEAVAAVGALLVEVGQGAEFTASAAAALSDGRITAAEAAHLAGQIMDRRRAEEATLLPALRATPSKVTAPCA